MNFNQAQLKVEKLLAGAATGYFSTGMRDFHHVRGNLYQPFQVCFGILAISIELMLKSVIAKRAPVLLYEGLPPDLQVKILYPSRASETELNRIEELGLTHFTFRTIELDKCIAVFYSLFPEEKQQYKALFDLLAVNRNSAVHAALQDFQRYDLERVAHLACILTKLLMREKVSYFNPSQLSREDEAFLERYDSERVERVKKAISKAREQSKREDVAVRDPLGHGWEHYAQQCPVCGRAGVMLGYSDMKWDNVDGEDVLFFYGEFYNCKSCGLDLGDSIEIGLAGMSSVVERDGEQDRWIQEFGYPEPPLFHEQD